MPCLLEAKTQFVDLLNITQINQTNLMKNIKLKFNLFSYTKKVVDWIYQVFNLSISSSERVMVNDLILRLDRLYESRGPVWTTKFCKTVRVSLWAYLSGKPQRSKGIKSTSDGLPRILGDLIRPIRKGPSPSLMQMVNTVLCSTRALNLGKIPDFDPITKNSTVSLNSKYKDYIHLF